MPRRFADDPAAWQALDTRYLFRKPPWLVLRHQRFRLPNGSEIADYWICEYPPWVNVVAVTAAEQVVLIRQYRPGLGDVHYEIEKAHPDLFNVLLQIMDHGKLTDHNGKQVDFRNVILIMTTNAGAADMAKAAFGFTRNKREGEDIEAAARRELAEETGYGGGRWSVLTRLSANPALQNNITTSYLAEGVSLLGRAQPEATEDLRVHLVPLAEIPDLIDRGEMVQALHTAPLLRYLLRRRT